MTTSTTDEHRTATTVLVIGSGAAGLRASIKLAESGTQVVCVGKRRCDDVVAGDLFGGERDPFWS